ncbi:MAG TPA: hypothetical protein VFH85_09925 [Gammaproteobacteria bacterium]|nr:hypothetical protein [Gammaproteobacteria bacterium]
MKTYLMIGAAVATLVLAGCASTVRTARNLNPFTPSTSFQKWDVNGDGVLSKSEARDYQPLAKNFNRLDSNGNGVIDENEYDAATTFLSPQPGFSSYDLNGDGIVTEDEAEAAPGGGLASDFDDVDADDDGNVSRAEFNAATTNLLAGVQFQSIDTDGDGSISGDEAEANAPLLWQDFDRVDLNGDDQITKAEYDAFESGKRPAKSRVAR